MKNLIRCTVAGCALLWPLAACAGEQEVKAQFLLLGGIGGILIGAGLYAAFMGLAVFVAKSKRIVAALFALATAFFGYMQYKSFYFLALATGFLRTRQMRYKVGELTTGLQAVLAFIGVWGVGVFVAALLSWRKRHRKLPS